MKKPSVIIVEGHVQGLSNLRSIAELGVITWVIDKKKCIASASKYCSHFLQCPDFITTEFTEFLMKIGEQYDLKNCLLIPSNDHAVYNIASNKTRLSKHYKIVGFDIDIIDIIYDKSKLLHLAEREGVAIPATQYFTSNSEKLQNSISLPVLTKGRHGLTFYKTIGKKALISTSEEQLKNDLASIEQKLPLIETFTQEVIPFDGKNKTISFTAYSENGEIKTFWMGEKLREHPIQFGTATLAVSIRNEECLKQSQVLLKSLNYTGVCEIEYLLDPRNNKYKLIEINPRTWLWVGLAKECGIDYAKILYHRANDIPYDFKTEYSLGIMWYNPITDLVYSTIAIFKGKLSVFSYIRTLFAPKKINAFFHKGDLKPGFKYLASLFSFFKNR
jgi:predicted ATP-grasp superfamily ATP-dependent carboligase